MHINAASVSASSVRNDTIQLSPRPDSSHMKYSNSIITAISASTSASITPVFALLLIDHSLAYILHNLMVVCVCNKHQHT
jgi:hypothetical protein